MREKKDKDNEQALMNMKDMLGTMWLRNLGTGIRKYVGTYVVCSAIVELNLVLAYLALTASGLYQLFFIIDTFAMLVVLFGIFPLTTIPLTVPEWHLLPVELKDVLDLAISIKNQQAKREEEKKLVTKIS